MLELLFVKNISSPVIIFRMSFKDFLQNMKMWGAYVRIKTLFKWTFVVCLLTSYFVYVITKLVYVWIPLI